MNAQDDSLGEMNRWLMQRLVRELAAMGFKMNDLARDPQESLAELKVLPKYQRWWRETLSRIAECGPLLHAAGGRDWELPTQTAEWSTARERFCEDEGNRATLELVEVCLGALAAILTGKTAAIEVLFPDSSMHLVEGIYKNNRLIDAMYDILANALVRLIDAQRVERSRDGENRQIRLLEIGAGTGGLTSVVLPRLEAYGDSVAEYCFTDVSKSFLMRAQETYRFPALRTALLDIGLPPGDQDFTLAYDYVLAANVLHATRDVRRSVRNAKAVLRNGGYLLLNELSGKSLAAHLSFGLLDGWWSYEDPDLRLSGSPAVHPDTWRDVLEEEGFTAIDFPAHSYHDSGQQVIVARSNGVVRQRTVKKATRDTKVATPAEATARSAAVDIALETPELVHADAMPSIERVVIEALADSLKMSAGDIEKNMPFWDYGMDSILAAKFVGRIASQLGIKMNTAVVFDHSNVNRLVTYIEKTHPGSQGPPAQMRASTDGTDGQDRPEGQPAQVRRGPKNIAERGSDIAVIGMSGQFPGATDIEAFWENLVKGTDGIGELPPQYLDQERYFAERKATGKTTCKWGGILQERDCFDPMFFNLSPREASSMSFHQRLVLQEGWRALENAAINPSSLDGQLAGLYIGAEPASYAYRSFTGASDAIVASRLSYFLNLKGPALVINTACSSSAVALHLACEALRSQEINLAIAGGVSAGIEQGILIALSEIEMLSNSGRCRTFDARADGTVLAEGIGIVVLKRLADAKRDGDPIYGVIVASGINQDGRSNGITSPSGSAQEDLIASVYKRFDIDPRRISYVEAHGTGTRLGDPVEANALVRAFRKCTRASHYCAIGSAKAYVGHTAAAAGVVGLIKVLLSLREQQIPGLLNFGILNPLIEFADSPFRINTAPIAWSPRGEPRMAALNSFGHSGTNAHLVIREYPAHDDDTALEDRPAGEGAAVLVPLSAKTRESLRNGAARLSAYLQSASHSRIRAAVRDLAYTLQIGRDAMQERAIFLASSESELVSALEDYAKFGGSADRRWEGTAEDRGNAAGTGSRVPAAAAAGSKTPELQEVARHWVRGGEVAWDRLYVNKRPSRVHLPGYVFAKELYSPGVAPHDEPVRRQLHPLVQARIQDDGRQAYGGSFSGNEFFLADHCFKDQHLMPAVAYLEMARAAAELSRPSSGEERGIEIRDVVWSRPLIATGSRKHVEIELRDGTPRELEFAIREQGESRDEDATLVKGRVVYGMRTANLGADASGLIRIDERLRAGGKVRFAPDACYAFFREVGMAYGEGLQGIAELYVDEDEVVARLRLPPAVAGTAAQYVLHPTILDSAIQAAVGFILAQRRRESASPQGAALPIVLERLEIVAPCNRDMWASVRRSGAGASEKIDSLDIDLCDLAGRVCARVRGLSSRKLPVGATVSAGAGILSPRWEKRAIRESPVAYDSHVVFLCEFDDDLSEGIARDAGKIQYVSLRSRARGLGERYTEYAALVLARLREIMRGPKEKMMVQILVRRGTESEVFAGLGSLLKTAELECPSITGQCIVVEAGAPEYLRSIVKANRISRPEQQVAYFEDQRWVIDWQEVQGDLPQGVQGILPWKEGGVYVITGGAGALGGIVAREVIAAVDHATVILLGRSPESEALRSKLRAIPKGNGGRIEYRQLDITRAQQVADVIASLRDEYGCINGVLHSAGIHRDSFILKKTRQELEDVLAPKVLGLVNLDLATKDIALDFFVAFSSATAITGNPGQADYACANGFMDAYLHYRSRLQERNGLSLAINWPLWEQGGMRVDAATQAMMKRTMGVLPMSSSTGIRALRLGLLAQRSQMLVVEGDLGKFRAALLHEIIRTHDEEPASQTQRGTATAPADASREIERKASELLSDAVAAVLELPARRIDFRAPMEKYGIDSIMIMKLTERLERDFGALPKTLFFEHRDLQGVASYFVAAHSRRLLELLEAAAAPSQPNDAVTPDVAAPERKGNAKVSEREGKFPQPEDHDIAIVGLAGRFPGARNIDEFWTVLSNGRDCITPVPDERWAIGRSEAGQRWGGFIEGVEKFDARFFGISPREAVLIDPQERLFLQCVYETLEDAGYSRKALARSRGDGLAKVAVYVGVMYEEYQLYGAQQSLEGKPLALTGSPSSIANRVSYWFDFHGPSMAVDTMCSSSLTAMHMACRSLHDGECDYAIAGGVNVTVHPNKYILLAQGRFLSSSGRCESFGRGGDGYVPGEAVGAVLLKRKQQAIDDGDHIYGLIKGTAVNHGGKSNGYTVPNPAAQADVIRSALRQGRIAPRSVSYIEAHGTGTSLGDPIEVSALATVFRESTRDTQFCAIGSVKSNIGHCESAAGIAALSKVLLQLRHRQLAPSLHSRPANPNINFHDTPFKVQEELGEWQRPTLVADGETQMLPRIAGISSFGAGGSNAHLVIAEHADSEGEGATPAKAGPGECLVPLSARSTSSLLQMAKNLLVYLEATTGGPVGDLVSIAYTLQTGREAMEHRLAFLVSTRDELQLRLRSFIAGDQDIRNAYRGKNSEQADTFAHIGERQEFAEALDKWVAKNDLKVLAELWTKGVEIDWRRLYPGRTPRKARLPTYPFELRDYWFDGGPAAAEETTGAHEQAAAPTVPTITTVDATVSAKARVSLRELAVAGEESSRDEPEETATAPQELARNDRVVRRWQLDSIKELLRRQLAGVLYLGIEDISVDEKFVDIGLDSITGVEWIKGINQEFGTDVAAARLYDHSTINALARHIREMLPDNAAAQGAGLPDSSGAVPLAVLEEQGRGEQSVGKRAGAAAEGSDGDEPNAEILEQIDADVLEQLHETLSELSRGDLTIDQAERQIGVI